MILLKDARERERFFKFAVVGTIGFGVDFAVFNFFLVVLGFTEPLSNVFSFTAAVISNFILNRYWTFPDSRSKSLSSQLVQYIAVNLVGLGIRTWIMVLIVEPLKTIFVDWNLPVPIAPHILGANLALVIVVIIVLFWNFFVNRYWTYNDVN